MKTNYYKYIFILAIISCLTVSFCSCEKPNRNKSQSTNSSGFSESMLVGKWQFIQEVEEDTIINLEECEYLLTHEYRADNTLLVTDYCEDRTVTGKWEIRHGYLEYVLDLLPISISVKIKELTNDKLITSDMMIFGIKIESHFKRIG